MTFIENKTKLIEVEFNLITRNCDLIELESLRFLKNTLMQNEHCKIT
jgi:hypothetical protein